MNDRRLVLVVEDSADCAATIELALAPLSGIEVRVIKTAEDALLAVAGTNVAAVITDIELRGMNGLELVAHLRSEQRYATLPVLVVSGAAGRDAPARALEAGATAFFSKPFSPAAVRQKLEGLIDVQ